MRLFLCLPLLITVAACDLSVEEGAPELPKHTAVQILVDCPKDLGGSGGASSYYFTLQNLPDQNPIGSTTFSGEDNVTIVQEQYQQTDDDGDHYKIELATANRGDGPPSNIETMNVVYDGAPIVLYEDALRRIWMRPPSDEWPKPHAHAGRTGD